MANKQVLRLSDTGGSFQGMGGSDAALLPNAALAGNTYLVAAAYPTAVNFAVKTFHQIVTLGATATTAVGLTPAGVIIGAAFRVSTQIDGLSPDNHTISLGVAGTVNKYGTATQGAGDAFISVNKKAKYAGVPLAETLALILTIEVGGDCNPTAGAVEVVVHYYEQIDIPNP
jgi:hypothetical protein